MVLLALSHFSHLPTSLLTMKVFKFGGASINSIERIKNVGEILQKYEGEQLLIVVSALGKTTNSLEKVVDAFYQNKKEEALQIFETIKQDHLKIYGELTVQDSYSPLTTHNSLSHSLLTTHHSLSGFFTEIEWLLHDKPVRDYDYYYDQIVCIGEILSSFILSEYLNKSGIKNKWIDVRDVIRTDDNFRDAKIDWEITAQKTEEQIKLLYAETKIVLTQGFIGATDENESTTLGREGSDYSAAVFANLLNAESQTIWKDVQGVMNADPKLYADAQWIKELNYREVIEMAYYGAQVIHPKTIKPLQNKGIPLYVKSFIHPDEEGTWIHDENINHLPPIIVYKANQALVQLSSKDYSFVGEGLTAEVNALFEELKFKPNLTQITAISLLCVIDDRPEKVEAFALKASTHCDVLVTKNLTMLTVRHYQKEVVDKLTKDYKILLQQQTPETVQMLLSNL